MGFLNFMVFFLGRKYWFHIINGKKNVFNNLGTITKIISLYIIRTKIKIPCKLLVFGITRESLLNRTESRVQHKYYTTHTLPSLKTQHTIQKDKRTRD